MCHGWQGKTCNKYVVPTHQECPMVQNSAQECPISVFLHVECNFTDKKLHFTSKSGDSTMILPLILAYKGLLPERALLLACKLGHISY